MRFLLVGCLAACSFDARVSTDTTVDADVADAAPDAPPDTPVPLAPCNVGVAAMPGTDRGRVGSDNGGDNFPPLVCDNPTDRIVGAAVRMSNQNTIYNARSAHGLQISCAPVTIDRNTGVGTTGTPYEKEVMGSGAEMWSPSTLGAVTRCPAGMVINGFQTHRGPNGNLFNNVNFRCAQLDANALTIANPVVHVAGSLNEAMGTDTVNCPVNEVIVQMSNRTGSGFDSVNVFCAAATCL